MAAVRRSQTHGDRPTPSAAIAAAAAATSRLLATRKTSANSSPLLGK